ncbi:MAG: hypothetical protein WCF88_06260 [Candidatus Acidiferrales bacterium]|jgi:hypothetical protein
MLRYKTHFEQVPLAVVQKILKETGAEAAIELARADVDQKLPAQESVVGTLGGRRKNLSLVRGKQVRNHAH